MKIGDYFKQQFVTTLEHNFPMHQCVVISMVT